MSAPPVCRAGGNARAGHASGACVPRAAQLAPWLRYAPRTRGWETHLTQNGAGQPLSVLNVLVGPHTAPVVVDSRWLPDSTPPRHSTVSPGVPGAPVQRLEPKKAGIGSMVATLLAPCLHPAASANSSAAGARMALPSCGARAASQGGWGASGAGVLATAAVRVPTPRDNVKQQRLHRSLSLAANMSQPPPPPPPPPAPPPLAPQTPTPPVPGAPAGGAILSAGPATPPPHPTPYAPTTVISLPTPAAGAVTGWAVAVGLILGLIAAGVAAFWLKRAVAAVRNAPRDRRADSRRSSRAPSRASSLESVPESAKAGRGRSGRIQTPLGRDEEAGTAEAGANPFGWFAWMAALFQPQHGAAPTAAVSGATNATSETSSGAGSGVHRGKR